MMNDPVAHMGFVQPATVCLADTSLLTPPMADAVSDSPSKEEKKPVKKRKSWGQELPVPKTNLPPRKRAKTDDEKEQRRIERVLRNRQAAQSSRERKRLEVEKLEGERDAINSQNQLLRQRLLQVEEDKFKMKQELMEIRALLAKHTGSELTPESSPSPRISSELFSESSIKQELDELPLLSTARKSVDPHATFTPEASPVAQDLTEASPAPDVTQHPAAVLCDLQCPSPATSLASAEIWSDAALRDPTQALATQLLFRRIHSSVYSTVLTPLCQLLASLKKGSRLRVTTITPTLFQLILWLISTPTSPLAPRTSSTTSSAPPPPPTSTTRTRSTSSPSTTRSSTFRTSLLRRFLACSPALARPLKDATAAALHEKARHALGDSSDDQCRSGVEEDEMGAGCRAGGSASKAEVWRLMTMALVIDQFERERAKREEAGSGY